MYIAHSSMEKESAREDFDTTPRRLCFSHVAVGKAAEIAVAWLQLMKKRSPRAGFYCCLLPRWMLGFWINSELPWQDFSVIPGRSRSPRICLGALSEDVELVERCAVGAWVASERPFSTFFICQDLLMGRHISSEGQ